MPTAVEHPVFSRVYKMVSSWQDAVGGKTHRKKMLSGLEGRVIEVGSGPGMNFAHYPTAVTSVVAIEPEAHMRKMSSEAARQAPVPVELREGAADSLPADDASFDAGVSSFVMCSVPDSSAALSEMFRVIRPGGELRFYEHVRAFHAPLDTLQDLANLWWPKVGGGCNCNRDTLAAIQAAGFQVQECRRFYFLPCPLVAPVAPLILGRALRP